MTPGRDGGTGRRSGLKIRRGQPRGGSTPPPGTSKIKSLDGIGLPCGGGGQPELRGLFALRAEQNRAARRTCRRQRRPEAHTQEIRLHTRSGSYYGLNNVQLRKEICRSDYSCPSKNTLRNLSRSAQPAIYRKPTFRAGHEREGFHSLRSSRQTNLGPLGHEREERRFRGINEKTDQCAGNVSSLARLSTVLPVSRTVAVSPLRYLSKKASV
jgi:hypothetical protein